MAKYLSLCLIGPMLCAASACPVGVADDASSKFGTHRGQDAPYIFHSPDTTCRSVHSPPGFRNTFHQEEDRASHATRRSAVTAQQRANEPPPAATIVRRRGHQPDPVVHRLFIRVVTKPKPGVALVGLVSLDKLLAAVRPLPWPPINSLWRQFRRGCPAGSTGRPRQF